MKPAAAILDMSISRVSLDERSDLTDKLAVEEPLEIRIGFERDGRREHRAISITMRTPGADAELAVGFLFGEGIIKAAADVLSIRHCGPKGGNGADQPASNTIRVDLKPGVEIDLKRLERHFYTTSSCGVCGKTSIEALQTGAQSVKTDFMISSSVIHRLPQVARSVQDVFDRTGGLHASALFDRAGKLDVVREDVGRHNALDKVIGAKLLAGGLPANDSILLVSGRASFELVQKALMAGIPFLAAVGAPSSLAVELAREFHMTLIGFVRDDRFNIYCGEDRVI